MTEPHDTDDLPILDDEPKDGEYRHLEDQPLTDEEIADGNTLGESIDVDNDNDNGLEQ
jgi:hypothetical protein